MTVINSQPGSSLIFLLQLKFLIHSADPTVTASSDHCFHKRCPSAHPHISKFKKQNKFQVMQCSLLARSWVWPSGSSLTTELLFLFSPNRQSKKWKEMFSSFLIQTDGEKCLQTFLNIATAFKWTFEKGQPQDRSHHDPLSQPNGLIKDKDLFCFDWFWKIRTYFHTCKNNDYFLYSVPSGWINSRAWILTYCHAN